MGVLEAVAAVSLAATAYSTYEGIEGRKSAARAQDKAREEEKRINAERRGSEAAKAAAERRRQIREANIRRAAILQSAENSGVSASSGALGSVSALSTNLGSNLGFNLGETSRAGRIGGSMDSISNFQGQANRASNRAAMWGDVGSFSQGIFGGVGGYKTLSNIWN